MRPVPEFSSAVESDHLLAIGAVQSRMLILVDIVIGQLFTHNFLTVGIRDVPVWGS